MNVRKIIPFLGSSSPAIPWYLAGGLIPESTSYTIYDPLAASSQSNSYINLSNPGTRDASPTVAPSWASGTGWQFNGTTQYIDTQTPFLATHTLVIWNDNWAAVYSAGSTKILVRPINSLSTRLTITTNTDLVGQSTNSILALRSAQGAYRNGKKLANMGTFTVAGTNYNVFIGARNNAGSAANFGSGYVLRYAHYDFALSDAQIEALFNTMRNYNLPADVSYKNIVLSTNPVAYYTMNQNYGKFFIDETGGLAVAEAFTAFAAPSGITVGHTGPTGKGLAAKGSVSASAQIQTQDNDWATITGIDLNEYSFACWIRNLNADAQARPCNTYSNTQNEYFAVEIRLGAIVAYSKENGVTWDTGLLASTTNDTWHHLVGFNSLSQNKIGIYLDGVKYEMNKGTTGFSDTSPDATFPYFLQTMNGYMCHMAFYDHALSQSEVNTLYVP